MAKKNTPASKAAQKKTASAPSTATMKEHPVRIDIMNGQPDTDKELCTKIMNLRLKKELENRKEITIKLDNGAEITGTPDIQDFPDIPAKGKVAETIITFTVTR